MADSVAKIVVDILRKDCSDSLCPYKLQNERDFKRLEEKLAKALKHRVADGNEVRKLEKQLTELKLQIIQLKNKR